MKSMVKTTDRKTLVPNYESICLFHHKTDSEHRICAAQDRVISRKSSEAISGVSSQNENQTEHHREKFVDDLTVRQIYRTGPVSVAENNSTGKDVDEVQHADLRPLRQQST